MTSLAITTIKADCQIATSINDTNVTFGNTGIWFPDLVTDDSGFGSLHPATFLIPAAPTNTYVVPLAVMYKLVFPAAWAGQRYRLSAWLGVVEVLRGAEKTTPTTRTEEYGNEDELTLLSPGFGAAVCPVPFRWGGQFTWRATLVEPPAQSVSTTQTTLLELCWARAPASQGIIDPATPADHTRVGLNHGYPIELFRLFAPEPTEFPAANFANVFRSWFINRSMQHIWGWPTDPSNKHFGTPIYDCEGGGASNYNVTDMGGSFKLRRWLESFYPKCNCMDLAAIAQLACAILVDEHGVEEVDSRWISHEPHGYILPGPLYGRLGGPEGRCNSPFWPMKGTAPEVAVADPLRSSFGRHVWIEVALNPATPLIRSVLDATHALAGNLVPDAGTSTRANYLTAQLDPQGGPRGNADDKSTANPAGNCSLNPVTRTRRIGVTDTKGYILQPNGAGISSDMAEIILIGAAPAPVVAVFNGGLINDAAFVDSLLDFDNYDPDANVVPYVAPTSTTYTNKLKRKQHPSPFLTLMSSSASASSSTAAPAIRAEDTEIVIIDITVFSNFNDPMSALASYLASFEAPVKEIVSRPKAPLGSHSYLTPRAVFWVRGNMFIQLRSYGSKPITSYKPSIADVAVKIDQYLAKNAGDRGAPKITLDAGAAAGVRAGGRFVVKVLGDKGVVGLARAFSGNGGVVLPVGGGGTEITFCAVAAGTTTVDVCVTDPLTLRPGKASFTVTVGK